MAAIDCEVLSSVLISNVSGAGSTFEFDSVTMAIPAGETISFFCAGAHELTPGTGVSFLLSSVGWPVNDLLYGLAGLACAGILYWAFTRGV